MFVSTGGSRQFNGLGEVLGGGCTGTADAVRILRLVIGPIKWKIHVFGPAYQVPYRMYSNTEVHYVSCPYLWRVLAVTCLRVHIIGTYTLSTYPKFSQSSCRNRVDLGRVPNDGRANKPQLPSCIPTSNLFRFLML